MIFGLAIAARAQNLYVSQQGPFLTNSGGSSPALPNAVYWTLVRCARNRRQGPNASPALLAARPTGSTELVSDDLPIFYWRHDVPGSANPVQQSLTVIEIRPFKGGWQCYEEPGVEQMDGLQNTFTKLTVRFRANRKHCVRSRPRTFCVRERMSVRSQS